MTSNPILVLGISSVLLGTAITSRKVLGIALGAIGAVTLMIIGGQSEGDYSSWQGDLMILLNATSYGFYLVLVKPLMSKYRPLTVISWVFAFGAVWVLPIGMEQALAVDWSAFELSDWQGVAYVVLGTTFMVYLLNIYALRIVQPTVVSIYIYLQPILTTGFSFLLASAGGRDYTSDLGWYTVLCAAAIFLGVALVSLPVRSSN
jgi:drug/metabolite transporter (DMT)-like permease